MSTTQHPTSPMRPRFTVYTGKSAVFLLDDVKRETSDPVIAMEPYIFDRHGLPANQRAAERRLRIKAARLNRECYEFVQSKMREAPKEQKNSIGNAARRFWDYKL